MEQIYNAVLLKRAGDSHISYYLGPQDKQSRIILLMEGFRRYTLYWTVEKDLESCNINWDSYYYVCSALHSTVELLGTISNKLWKMRCVYGGR